MAKNFKKCEIKRAADGIQIFDDDDQAKKHWETEQCFAGWSSLSKFEFHQQQEPWLPLLISYLHYLMDYIYSYNCSPISQFYSDFKITLNSVLLIIRILVPGKNFRAIPSVVYPVGVTTNHEQFCDIVVHNSLKFAWNYSKFCVNIDPNTLYKVCWIWKKSNHQN